MMPALSSKPPSPTPPKRPKAQARVARCSMVLAAVWITSKNLSLLGQADTAGQIGRKRRAFQSDSASESQSRISARRAMPSEPGNAPGNGRENPSERIPAFYPFGDIQQFTTSGAAGPASTALPHINVRRGLDLHAGQLGP